LLFGKQLRALSYYDGDALIYHPISNNSLPCPIVTLIVRDPTDHTGLSRITGHLIFVAENTFLGMNHLPSLNLNAIQTRLSLRLLAFHVVDNFRHDLGSADQKKTPELSLILSSQSVDLELGELLLGLDMNMSLQIRLNGAY
jgi:hypothetical protein